MKTRLTTLFCLFCIISSYAQTSDSTNFSFYKDDNILKKIIKALPPGWNFAANDSEFIFTRTDSVLAAEKLKCKVAPNKKISDDSIMKFGQKEQCRIVYKHSARWSYEQTLKASSNNMQIYQQINLLPDKYKITKLIDKSKSTRGNNVYTGNTDEEKGLIKQFESEKQKLLSKITLRPNYHSENYSLFLISTQGCNDDNYSVFPASASLELYQILALFSELTEKSFQN